MENNRGRWAWLGAIALVALGALAGGCGQPSSPDRAAASATPGGNVETRTAPLTAPNQPHYISVTDLGSTVGFSNAVYINNNSVVAGSDVPPAAGIYQRGYPGSHGFHWSATEGMVYVPWTGAQNYADAVNDAGVMSVSAGTNPWELFPCRYDLAVDTQPVCQTTPGFSTGINAAGTVTGYVSLQSGMRMFRLDAGSIEILPSAPNAANTLDAAGAWIDEDGSVVGTQNVYGGSQAVRYMATRGTEVLSDLLPAGSDWIPVNPANVRSGQIVGWGDHGSYARAFRIRTTANGDVVAIDTIPMPSTFEPDAPNLMAADGQNAAGEIVGTIWDPALSYPQAAYVYTDAVQAVDLNTLIDPQSGWTLRAAWSVNDNHEVVGFGTHDGVDRAFKLTLPDLSPCPAPTDGCHLQSGPRDPLTEACSYPNKPDGTTCNDGLACTQGETCQAGTCQPPANPPPVVVNLPVDQLGASGPTYPGDINASGVVVGYWNSQASKWTGSGAPVNLGAQLGLGIPSAAYAINDGGTIVGYHTMADGVIHAFRSGAAGFEDFGPIGDGLPAFNGYWSKGGSFANSINNAGQFVGGYTAGGLAIGFRFTDGMTREDLGTLVSGGATLPYAIADSGAAVGSSWTRVGDPSSVHAVLYESGSSEPVDLNDRIDQFAGWTLLEATSISGDYIVGRGLLNGVERAFRLHRSTAGLYDIEEINGGWLSTLAYDVNAAGDVVGAGAPLAVNSTEGFVFTNQLGFKKLNDLIPPDSGWDLRGGYSINASGGIVGPGYHAGITGPFRLQLPVGGAATCAARNVCGGGDTDSVCLFLDGVVDLPGGGMVAVFGYDNGSSTSVHPTVNEERLGGVPVGNPHPAPPADLAPGTHNGAFLPTFTFDDHNVSWTVDGDTVTATASSPHLQPVPIGGNGLGVVIGGQAIVLRADTSKYSQPPDEPTPARDPRAGFEFNGVVAGQLSIGATGAAVYTVPISIPPGVGGMAPNLNLVYSSQGGNGIAGQGWDLAGLSVIHRCPKIRNNDGAARPVMMDPLDTQDEANTDGICIDGMRIYEDPNHLRHYVGEKQDFSQITRLPDDSFVVVTKSGETRRYGSTDNSRLEAASIAGIVPGERTAIWALDRVSDAWGNFYEVIYNFGLPDLVKPTLFGFFVTQINYTGHLTNGVQDVPPPMAIKFGYEGRPDVRWSRFGNTRFPRHRDRLKTITTPRGEYTLSYYNDNGPTLPSRLLSIGYSAGGASLNSLTFGWQSSEYDWQQSTGYQLPPNVAAQVNLTGVQFVDLDRDGLLDVVLAKMKDDGGFLGETWRNNGQGWDPGLAPLPVALADKDGVAAGVRIADIDGDGRADVIKDHGIVACDGGGCTPCAPGQALAACGHCRVVNLEQVCDKEFHDVSPLVWTNQGGGNGWQFRGEYLSGSSLPGLDHIQFDGLAQPDVLVDLNGDGRADILRYVSTTFPGPYLTFHILLNTGSGWRAIPEIVLSGVNVLKLADYNRDGMPDVIGEVFRTYPDGHIEADSSVYINQGGSPDEGLAFSAPIVHGATPGGTAVVPDPPASATAAGDLDGDGLLDVVRYYPIHSTTDPAAYAAGVGLADGGGASFSGAGAQPYLDILRAFSPIQLESGNFYANDFGFSLVDINADGLADLVRNHAARIGDILDGPGGGQVLINTGTTWEALDGVTGWQIRPGRGAVPIVPDPTDWNQTPKNPPVFIDLNGDGVTDVINAKSAWLNSFQRPTINSFPNGLDSGPTGTVVEYDVITTGAARAGSNPTYTDSGTLDDGTAYATLPIRVVKAMHVPNGIGGVATTSYQYSDLRVSAFHYGSQGFKTVTITEPTDATTGAAGLITETTYAQMYPFTGVPLSVSRYTQDPVTRARTGLVTSTATQYCERNLPDQPGVTCGDMTPKLYPPHSTFFVHPTLVQETSILRTSLFPQTETFRRVHTTTEFHFDDLGNSTRTTVTIQGLGETHVTETRNDYGNPGSLEQQQGNVTRMSVTTTAADGSTRSHANAFEYRTFSGALALAKKKVNPDAPDDDHARVDTAYDYDRFGNTTTITSCESNFDACETNASSTLPFRTTRITYDPVEAGLTVGYGPGRFPAMITNAVGHQEFTVYDPLFGVILNRTDPNGIQTCIGYDAFGQMTYTTLRCNSTDPANPPLTTTTKRNLAVDTFGTNARVVTITTPPGGTPTWTFTDVLGRPVAVVTRSFGGGFAETLTEYDFLGRVRRTSKPFLAGGEPAWTETKYDPLGRPTTISQDLGRLGDVSTGAGTATSVLTMTYGVNNPAAPSGVSVQSTRVVFGKTRSKLETKNAIGKVVAVTEIQPSSAVNQTMKYEYDADGNLTKTTDPADNAIVIGYDVYGRKTSTQDPDLGTWSYTYNGFGEPVGQKDAKDQTTTSTYDLIGRLTSRTDLSGVSEWVYDVAPGAGKGKLAATAGVPDPGLRGTCTIPFIAGPGNRPGKSLTYTAFGDLAETEECVDGDTFRTTYQYDGSGRPEVLTYPDVNGTRFAVRNHYTGAGYLHFVSDPTNDSIIYWAASDMNAAGQVTSEFTGNGVDTVSAISPATGWLLSRASTANLDGGKLIQSRALAFDEAGNLRRRVRTDQVATTHSDEVFTYDDFDRSLGFSEASTNYGEGYGYDALGNISTKATQTNNTYHYNTGCMAGTQRAAGPHAVCSITGGLTASFSYDENGNMVSGGGREITYNPSNKVTQLDYQSPGGSATSVAFSYGGDGNRVLQEVTASGSTARTIYVGLGSTGKSLYERTTRTTSGTTTTEHTHFIYAGGAHGGNAFAVRVVSDGGSPAPAIKYQHFDHLGSVTAVSGEQGRVVDLDSTGRNPGVLSYDPWGARRASETVGADPSAYDSPPGHREFTGHETIPSVGLVNMNGRIYDPILGRFLSPDPNIQSVASSQSYNRYSYVLNNPLKYTDPTGYWFHELMSGLMSGVTTALQKYNPTTMEGFKNLFELGLGAFVCAASEGVGCALWTTGLAIFDTAVAISNGAPVVQSLEQLGIGLAVGYLAGKTGATGPITSMLNGAASAAVTTGLTNVVKGRPLGENVLGAAGAAAATAGIKYVIKYEVALSQAASERQARNEAMERLNSVAAGIAAERAQIWVGPLPPLITDGALVENEHGPGDKLYEAIQIPLEATKIILDLGRHYFDPDIPKLSGITTAVTIANVGSAANSLAEGRYPIKGLAGLALPALDIPPPYGEIASLALLVGSLFFDDPEIHTVDEMATSFCGTLPICSGSPAGMAGF